MIKSNSKLINEGDTFIAIKGKSLDGHNFIEEAIKNGAQKIIAEHGNYPVKTTIVQDTRFFYSEYLKKENKDILSKIKIIGVTGTNGKTTTSFYIYQLLRKLNKKSAFIGTIGFYTNEYVKSLKNTTPSLEEIYDLLKICYKERIEYVVMEVSSASLDNGRVDGIDFDIGIFTNITHDHLDYHKSFENYIECKRKLFENIKKQGKAIINIDDDNSMKFILNSNNNITFGLKESDFKVVNFKLYDNKTKFKFKYNRNFYNVNLNNPGIFNVYNFMASLITLNSLGFQLVDILAKSSNLMLPPGRYDTLIYNNNKIIIDFAHSPDSVEKILEDISRFKKGKLITILGCSGNSDKKKRPVMGKIATKLSDVVIFTNDNPGIENEEYIMKDITANLNKDSYIVIYDREKAIKEGMKLLTSKDILVILGKGHETYQIIGGEKIPYNDKFTVLKYMK